MKFFLLIILPVLLSSCSYTNRVDITIVYTTGVEGEFEPCGCPKHPLGGISKRAKYVEELRKKEKYVVLLDSGDLFFPRGNPPFGLDEQWRLKARLIAEAYNIMKPDAIGTGETDLAMGMDYLKELTTEYQLDLIASNLIPEVRDLFHQYKIIEIGGKKIGIISLIQPELLSGKTTGLQIQELVRFIRKQADSVILLSHLSPGEEENLLKNGADIDIIISSHYGYSQKPVHINNGIIATAGSRGKYIGILRLTFYGNSPYRINAEGNESGTIRYSGEWVPVEQDLPSDTGIDKLIDNYHRKVAELNSHIQEQENILLANAEKCAECHIKQYNFWKTTKHSQAYKTLEKEGKNLDPECVGCHTTGYRKPGGFSSPAGVGKMKGVRCNACHINSTEHARSRGQMRINKFVPETTCRECHTAERSPDFNYMKRLPLISCPVGR